MNADQARRLQEKLGGPTIVLPSDNILVIPKSNTQAIAEAVHTLGMHVEGGYAFGFNPLRYVGLHVPASVFKKIHS